VLLVQVDKVQQEAMVITQLVLTLAVVVVVVQAQ